MRHFLLVVHFEPVAPLQSVGSEAVDRLYPPYLIRDSPWEYEWRRDHPDGWEMFQRPWDLAKRGDLPILRLMAEIDPDLLSQPNGDTGWEPLLYACLRGHLDVVTFLVEEFGVNVNVMYPDGSEFLSALDASDRTWGDTSAVSAFLRSHAAVVDPRPRTLPSYRERSEVATAAAREDLPEL
jgi:hypothetical protein